MTNIDNKKILALKYARAFINIYIDSINLQSFDNIKKLEKFFDAHRKSIYFLSVPNIKTETKEKFLNQIFEKFELKTILSPLIKILGQHKRIFLIDEILKNIRRLYKEQKNIIIFKISSSHPIKQDDIAIIEKFLESRTKKKIITSHKLDKSLIAGIKIKSSTFLWEYSIAKQCENLRKQFNI